MDSVLPEGSPLNPFLSNVLNDSHSRTNLFQRRRDVRVPDALGNTLRLLPFSGQWAIVVFRAVSVAHGSSLLLLVAGLVVHGFGADELQAVLFAALVSLVLFAAMTSHSNLLWVDLQSKWPIQAICRMSHAVVPKEDLRISVRI